MFFAESIAIQAAAGPGRNGAPKVGSPESLRRPHGTLRAQRVILIVHSNERPSKRERATENSYRLGSTDQKNPMRYFWQSSMGCQSPGPVIISEVTKPASRAMRNKHCSS